jgi:hypothetical protein
MNIAAWKEQPNHQNPHHEMGIFLLPHSRAPLETMIDFQVFIVYTEIGNIGREEKLLDHAFLMK